MKQRKCKSEKKRYVEVINKKAKRNYALRDNSRFDGNCEVLVKITKIETPWRQKFQGQDEENKT
jgi:hypothetical protein